MMSNHHTSGWVLRTLAFSVVPLWCVACGTPSNSIGSGAGGTVGATGGSGAAAPSNVGGQATGGMGTGGMGAGGGMPTGGMPVSGTGGMSAGGGMATGGALVNATGGMGTGGMSAGDTGGMDTIGTGGTGSGGEGIFGSPSGGSGAAAAAGGGGNSGGGGMAAAGGAPTGGASGSATGGSVGDSAGPCPASGTLKAGDARMLLTVEGNEYPYVVHVPPGYDGVKRLPVVFDFHGLGGDENQMKGFSGWASTGDAEGFITVFPGGIENAWNAGMCCNQVTTDVAFVRRAIATLDSEGCIDTKRVYASGCSNGGGMSFRLACEAADVIAAVAPVDFDCVLGAGCSDCSPSRPITVVQFRGTSDQMVPYDGGTGFSGAQANFEKWGQINGCTGSPEPLPENADCQAYMTCSADVQTILCTSQGGSHCGSYSSFGIADTAWSVLKQYSLP